MTLPREGSSSASKPVAAPPQEAEDGLIVVRRPRLEYGDGGAMWRLAIESGVLEENAEYTYHMFSHYFGETSTVAEVDGRAVGFVAGFRPPYRQDSLFVWQIAVDESVRGRGLAAAMLHGLIRRLSPRIHYLEATVTPSNEPSTRTFRGIARDLDTGVSEEILFPGDRFHGPSHEDEVLFRIGPIDPERVAEYALRQEQQAAANGIRNLHKVVDS
ncbi:MAG: diaminobutyrate acetyltransferase [Dehalococcoidia bacterium]|nr:diaminobutyrate acetyltransferase [Dehalococcoidia bacterium]